MDCFLHNLAYITVSICVSSILIIIDRLHWMETALRNQALEMGIISIIMSLVATLTHRIPSRCMQYLQMYYFFSVIYSTNNFSYNLRWSFWQTQNYDKFCSKQAECSLNQIVAYSILWGMLIFMFFMIYCFLKPDSCCSLQLNMKKLLLSFGYRFLHGLLKCVQLPCAIMVIFYLSHFSQFKISGVFGLILLLLQPIINYYIQIKYQLEYDVGLHEAIELQNDVTQRQGKYRWLYYLQIIDSSCNLGIAITMVVSKESGILQLNWICLIFIVISDALRINFSPTLKYIQAKILFCLEELCLVITIFYFIVKSSDHTDHYYDAFSSITALFLQIVQFFILNLNIYIKEQYRHNRVNQVANTNLPTRQDTQPQNQHNQQNQQNESRIPINIDQNTTAQNINVPHRVRLPPITSTTHREQ